MTERTSACSQIFFASSATASKLSPMAGTIFSAEPATLRAVMTYPSRPISRAWIARRDKKPAPWGQGIDDDYRLHG
jgi:hypothetical protein